ncbi:hypothetical protein MTO96_052178 [Rhipicephalus appendiculatus]
MFNSQSSSEVHRDDFDERNHKCNRSSTKCYMLGIVLVVMVLSGLLLYLAFGAEKAWITDTVSHERVPAPGIVEKPVAAATVPETTAPTTTNRRAQPDDTMPVACVTGENTKESAVPADGVCDYLVFAHVALDESNSHFVDTGRHEGAFEAFLKAARRSSATQFLLSVSQRDSADFASQLGDEARASRVLGRYRATRIRGYGFAHYDLRDTEADRKQLKKLHNLLQKLRHLESGEELVVFIGVRFVLEPASRPNRLKELMKDISKSITFLVIITHVTPSGPTGPVPCVVEPIASWTNSSFNDHSHFSLSEAAELVRRQTGDAQRHQSFLLSSSMAVAYYNIEEDADSNPELKDVPCTGASVSSYATVCTTEMGWKVGAEGVADHVRYEQFPEVGKWRTYKTRPHLAAEMRAALDMQLGSRSEGLGWAFYDVDLDDGEGRCARTWKVRSAHEARFFRLKDAAANFREFKNEFRHTATRYRFR